ncbi:MAG: hypothetical protein M3O70_20740 [Actinomycetota bacterium]|nr:hypothetical protein [Actinomycetota bacterium]
MRSRSPFECAEKLPGREHLRVEHSKAGEVLISGDQRVDVGGPCQSHQVIVVGITTDDWHFDRVVEHLGPSVQFRDECTSSSRVMEPRILARARTPLTSLNRCGEATNVNRLA